jgi:hypothetical protein
VAADFVPSGPERTELSLLVLDSFMSIAGALHMISTSRLLALLGLSDQVAASVGFLSYGTSRAVKVRPMQVVLKRTTPRQMAAASGKQVAS